MATPGVSEHVHPSSNMCSGSPFHSSCIDTRNYSPCDIVGGSEYRGIILLVLLSSSGMVYKPNIGPILQGS